MCLTFNRDSVQDLLDSQRKKLTERNNALETMVMALNEETMVTTKTLSTRVKELEGELALCRAVVGKGVSSATLSNEDVPKPKEFVGTISACDVDNFLWRMENYFRAKDIVDDAVKFQCELNGQFYPEFTKEEVRAKLQGITQRGTVGGVQKLSESMMVVESVVKLGLGKDKLGSSKPKERGACEKDLKEDVVHINGNDDNCGNGKPRVGKKKPNRKMDKLKCFLCDGSYILKKCSKKSALFKKEKSMGKALGLGSSARGVKAKEAKSEKKPVECFLYHGPHKLQKCLKKSVIEGDDKTDKEPKKLGSSKGKAEAVVKGKATPELGESSEGLPLKEEVSLSSNLEEKVAMKTVKLRPMRFNLSEASELVESSTRLPPMGEVGDALDFKSK
ncbi:hypothetical protein Gotri_012109 [Gossypium trilobum]|uniref:Uncharacterized protein n=1 Tax=Gossypium trilobum TaxID=34281 RepID=A0A7J9DP56_9ROSI|nr:hypothetical protein [Gossypium trilobum]